MNSMKISATVRINQFTKELCNDGMNLECRFIYNLDMYDGYCDLFEEHVKGEDFQMRRCQRCLESEVME